MYTILHISDLHRSISHPFDNEEIVSALSADIARAARETIPIAQPNAIIVSGDLVQGLPLGSRDYPEGLREQYQVALELLVSLTETFVSGDRSKVVLIPGNHDVDFNKSFESMDIVNIPIEEVSRILYSSEDPMYRWNWKDGKLYRIRDKELYEDRFSLFNDLYLKFYDGVSLAHDLDPRRYYNLFELKNGEIVVCAFNSCFNNDCFSYVGEVPSKAVSMGHLTLTQAPRKPRLRIAVWHHDVAGPPKRTDYMDQEIVKLMIDRGYRLGFHGHQHKSDATPYSLNTSDKQTMAVVSAGSLCAGVSDIPGGVSRQYNIVEIADDLASARIHVRESREPKIFSPGRFISLGNRSYEDVNWTAYADEKPVNTADARAFGSVVLSSLENIERHLREKNFDSAIAELDGKSDVLGSHGRRLRIEALKGSGKWPELAALVSDPANADEAALLVRALVESREWTKVDEALAATATLSLLDAARIDELRHYALAERMLKS